MVFRAGMAYRQWLANRMLAALTVALAILCLSSTIASAQLSIQIGGSEADFKQRLARDGYTSIETKKLGLSSSIFEGCKAGRRYSIRFEWDGDVKRKVVGDCRTNVDERQVRQILRSRGFERITIEDRAGKYLAIGCQRGVRYRVELNYFGDITQQRQIGDCRREMAPEDIIADLEEKGYDRVVFTNRQPPRYVATACRERDQLELVISTFGEILSSRQIGRCRSGIDANEVVTILRTNGYEDAIVLEQAHRRFIAEACMQRSRYRITLNRWGEITDRQPIGRCRTPLSAAEIEASMRENGFTSISISQEAERFVTRGCRDNRYVEIVLSSFGELVNRREIGSCEAPRLNDLAESFRRRGMSQLEFFVEACEDRKKIRIRFDEFANRISREEIGRCR